MARSRILQPNNQSIHSSTYCSSSRCARVCLPREQEQVLFRVEAGGASGQCLAEANKEVSSPTFCRDLLTKCYIFTRAKELYRFRGSQTIEAGGLIASRSNPSTGLAVVECTINRSLFQPPCSVSRIILRATKSSDFRLPQTKRHGCIAHVNNM
jgi:hypothetical protein